MKDIAGYEGLYAVTSCGKVWSYKRKMFLKPFYNKQYPHVDLQKGDGKKSRKNVAVHRLVANAYISNPENLPCVNHKDENPRNPCVNNLEWCTQKYNANYGTKIIRQIMKTGKKTICVETGEIFNSLGEASRKTGIDRSLIADCCNLESPETHGLHFFYYDYFVEHFDELKSSLKAKRVYCETNDTYYLSCQKAADAFGVKEQSINRVCNGYRKLCKGHRFRYVEIEVIK